MVDILGSIDEKIESNNKIIDKNNAIMRLLFSNFYEKMKLSSETVPIGSLELTVSDFVANGSFASLKENVEILDNLSYAYFIRNTDLKAGAFNKFVSEDAYRFLAKSALYGHEVLISNVGDVGSVFLCPKLNKPMTLGNNMIFINSKGKDCYNYYLFFLFSSEEGQYLIRGITGGSAQPKFNKTDFRNIMVYNPSEKLLADFNKNVEVYLNRNTLCHSENLNLNRLKQLYLKKFFG
jgi:type I restriction enzyme S subunit